MRKVGYFTICLQRLAHVCPPVSGHCLASYCIKTQRTQLVGKLVGRGDLRRGAAAIIQRSH